MCAVLEKRESWKTLSWQTRKPRLGKPSNYAELISEWQSQQQTKSSQPERVGASFHEEIKKQMERARKKESLVQDHPFGGCFIDSRCILQRVNARYRRFCLQYVTKSQWEKISAVTPKTLETCKVLNNWQIVSTQTFMIWLYISHIISIWYISYMPAYMPYAKSGIIHSPKKKGHTANGTEYRIKLRHLTFKFRWTFYLLSAKNLEDNGPFTWNYTIFVLAPWCLHSTPSIWE